MSPSLGRLFFLDGGAGAGAAAGRLPAAVLLDDAPPACEPKAPLPAAVLPLPPSTDPQGGLAEAADAAAAAAAAGTLVAGAAAVAGAAGAANDEDGGRAPRKAAGLTLARLTSSERSKQPLASRPARCSASLSSRVESVARDTSGP